MDAASFTPPQQTEKATKIRHIPAEIIEEILLNLPLKSLVRFCSVSKSWNSMILGSLMFVKRYRGRERVVMNHYGSYDNRFICCPLPSILSDDPIEDTADLVCPFWNPSWKKHVRWGENIPAFCDELWCVQNKKDNSLFLWNPTMQTHRKLPRPPPSQFDDVDHNDFFYGLGYDSVSDDYKVVRIHDARYMHEPASEADLYSLSSDSWRKIPPFPPIKKRDNVSCFSTFVSGALHWLVRAPQEMGGIISFDLSTEKYGEVALPKYDVTPCVMEVVVARGKLCLCLTYSEKNGSIALWVMEDYGVVESWTNKFHIDCNTLPKLRGKSFSWKPLYFCDNGEILIAVTRGSNEKSSGIYMYRFEWKGLVMKKCGFFCNVYVESLVSPAAVA
ncbi:hypothetical protein C2S52_013692 [Perilla frutescens var. hirtella]|nr:hypothetical protein C2S52_013692 [Perilla frutescens var. hirtella]